MSIYVMKDGHSTGEIRLDVLEKMKHDYDIEEGDPKVIGNWPTVSGLVLSHIALWKRVITHREASGKQDKLDGVTDKEEETP